MKAIEYVVHAMKCEGVEYLFGYPMHTLIEAAAVGGIRPIIARTEKTLVNMADGYAMATSGDRPAVVCVQGGPGIENAFGGVAQAFADGTPMLILPGGGEVRAHGLGGEFDPIPAFSHVTKWAARVPSADRLPAMLRHAFAQMRNGRPGPVLLELPRDVMATDLSSVPEHVPPVRVRSSGDPADVEAAARVVLSAPRLVIHVGQGVLWAQATDALVELAELLDAPVVTTLSGKSAFPEDHRLSAGAGGLSIAHAAAFAIRECDVVLGIGCSFTQGSFSPPIPPGKVVIHATNDPRDLDKHVQATHAIVGDARLVIDQLVVAVRALKAAGVPGANRSAFLEGVADAKGAQRAARSAQRTASTSPINPYRVIDEVMRAIDPATAMVTHDSGNPRDQLLPNYMATRPRGYLGWGKSTQLGTGLGIAMGAKLAYPEKVSLNIMGDLAFGTAGLELETAVRERIGTVTVLLNNSVMGGYTAYMPVASERFGSNRLGGDYVTVARGLGAHAERVERPEDLAASISRAVAASRGGRPALVEVITKEEPVFLRARDAVLGAH
jgi:thiamine pyrophosphate-dependent acetolactate synthase large subunit-like protein